MVVPFPLVGAVSLVLDRQKGHRIRFTSAWCVGGLLTLGICMLAAIALSLSRMAFVSVLGSTAVMSFLVVNRIVPHRKWSALAAIGAILFMAFVFAAPLALVQRFGDLFFDPTRGGRWPIAKDTLQIFAAYPVFGSGFGHVFVRTSSLPDIWVRHRLGERAQRLSRASRNARKSWLSIGRDAGPPHHVRRYTRVVG